MKLELIENILPDGGRYRLIITEKRYQRNGPFISLLPIYNYINEIEVSNAVLRNRFGVESQNAAIVSRIIKNTLNAGKIKLADENSSQKNRKYVPYWA